MKRRFKMPNISLKTQNSISLVSLVVICLSIAWVSAYGLDELMELKSTVELLGGIVVLSPIVVLITNLISADIKHMLVFCRYKNALPGHRFIKLVNKDPRITSSDVLEKLSSINLTDMSQEEQNSPWYKEIYRPNQEDTQVKSAHKSFLLYRDAGVAVLLLSIIAMALHLINILIMNKTISLTIPIVLLVSAVILIFAASLSGKRMVTTAVCAQLINKD